MEGEKKLDVPIVIVKKKCRSFIMVSKVGLINALNVIGKCIISLAISMMKKIKNSFKKEYNPTALTDCSKKDLIDRITEFFTRINNPPPTNVRIDDMETYKEYLLEPFYFREYPKLKVEI